jgi:type IV pilus assembly protein PilP
VKRAIKRYDLNMALLLTAQLSAQEKNLVSPPKKQDGEVSAGRSAGANNVKNNLTRTEAAGRLESKEATGKPEVAEGKQEQAVGVRINTVGKRDPFRPITLNIRSNVRRRENLSPLERYELGQLKLVGVIWDIKNPTALVEDTTGLGYTVKLGTPIGANDGKVRTIKPGALVIEEDYIDLYGAKKKREVSMTLAVERSE